MKRFPFLSILCFFLVQWPLFDAASSGAVDPGADFGAQAASEIIAKNWPGNSNETWAWKQIRAGKPVGFDKPVSSWLPIDREGRKLDPRFVLMMLTHKAFVKEIPNTGVHIIGAVFEKLLDFSNTRIERRLVIEKSRLEQGADFEGLKSSAGISFEGSIFSRDLKLSRVEVQGNLTLNNVRFWHVRPSSAKPRGLPFIKEVKPTPGKDSPLDMHLRGATIDGSLFMNGGRFYSVDLQMARIKGQLDMRKATFEGPLHMALASEIYEIKMQGCKFKKAVFMPGLQVKSNLLLGGSTFREKLDLEGARIGLNLSMVNAEFEAVDLRRATVGGQLRIGKRKSEEDRKVSSSFAGKLIMYGLAVTDQLYVDKAVFKDDVLMHGVHVNANLSFRGSTFKSGLALNGAEIERDVFLDDARFESRLAELDLQGVRIHGNLVFKNVRFEGSNVDRRPMVDLSRASVGFIDYRGTRSLPVLDLSGTTVKKVFVSRNQNLWPTKIKMHGFQYSQFLFGPAEESNPQMPNGESQEVYESWLARLKPYTPQPYMQAAKVMRENGNPEVASQILYAGKEKELEEAPSPWLKAKLYLLKYTIGYGIYTRRVILHFLALWCVGTLFAFWRGKELIEQIEKHRKDDEESTPKISGRSVSNHIPASLFYSLDMMLPLIKLKFEHDRISLEGFSGYYFYFHKMAGWFLATVLVSSLTGLINPIK